MTTTDPKKNKNKDALRRASRKYQQRHIKQFKLDLNTKTDADIIAHLDRQENKTRYIKRLIRTDMNNS